MATQTAPAAGATVNTYGSDTYAEASRRAYIKKMEQEAQTSAYFARFTGEIDKYNVVPSTIVVKKTDLEKEGGDSVNIPMQKNVDPTFVYGDGTLLGNEASQEIYNLEVKVNQWRAAVSAPAKNANQRIKYLGMMERVRPLLMRAVSREEDADHFRALTEGYSLNLTTTTASNGLGVTKIYHHKIYGIGEATPIDNNATSLDAWCGATGTISSDDVLDLSSIDALKALGKKNKIVPIDFGSRDEWFVLLAHPNVIYTIQTGDSNAWRTGVQNAAERAKDNPFFSGAVWAYNGIILHEHPDCPSILGNGDNTITYSFKDDNTDDLKTSFLLGKSAIAYASGSGMSFQEEMYDYKNQMSVAAAQINGIARFDTLKDDGNDATFISQGSLQVISYAADPTP